MQPEQDITIRTSEQLHDFWDANAEHYAKEDSCMQTFFYTLINMLHLSNAKSVLEIACGSGRLLPLVLTTKPKECYYRATDIAEHMVQLTQLRLRKFAEKVGV